MKVSDKAVALVERFEGFSEEAYWDLDGWSIGYGHHGPGVKEGQKITQQDALELLKNDLEEFAAHVLKYVSVEITQSQLDAVVSFAYNVGLGNFQHSTLLLKLNAGDQTAAAAEFAKWNKAGGKILAGLEKRREAERELFLA